MKHSRRSVLASSFALGIALGSLLSQEGRCQGCAPLSPGLVGWWRGEGDAVDQSGTNNGTLIGNATFGAGEVGQAFVFDGNSSGVVLSNTPAPRLQNFTIEAWIQRASDTAVNLGPGPSFDALFFSYGTNGYGFGLDIAGHPLLTKVAVGGAAPNATVSDTAPQHFA